MPKATNEQYLSTMSAYNDMPLLHTVVFESVSGPESPIAESESLILAIEGLAKIRGVDIRAAHKDLGAPNIIEEAALHNNTVLQSLRHDPIHDELLDIARAHTNWRVVDRALPTGYDNEPGQIIRSREKGNDPIAYNIILPFRDDISPSDVGTLLRGAENVLSDATHELVFPAEVAETLDKRKGAVGIIRSNWHNATNMKRFLGSKGARTFLSDLESASDPIDITYKP